MEREGRTEMSCSSSQLNPSFLPILQSLQVRYLVQVRYPPSDGGGGANGCGLEPETGVAYRRANMTSMRRTRMRMKATAPRIPTTIATVGSSSSVWGVWGVGMGEGKRTRI